MFAMTVVVSSIGIYGVMFEQNEREPSHISVKLSRFRTKYFLFGRDRSLHVTLFKSLVIPTTQIFIFLFFSGAYTSTIVVFRSSFNFYYYYYYCERDINLIYSSSIFHILNLYLCHNRSQSLVIFKIWLFVLFILKCRYRDFLFKRTRTECESVTDIVSLYFLLLVYEYPRLRVFILDRSFAAFLINFKKD